MPSSVPVAPRVVIASPSDDAHLAERSRPTGFTGFTLREPAEFERCLARPALVRNGPFALHLAWRHDADAASCDWRLGLVIPKRYEASAVARNTIKRRCRATFRRGRAAWASEFGGADVVVRLQSPLIAKARGTASVVEPARVRARDRFDPEVLFDALAVRLRGRKRLAAAVG